MTFEPSPRQALVLWSLVVAAPGEEPSRSSVKPKLRPAERKQLLSAAFIEEEKRGRSTHLVLAEQGWAWAERQREIRLSPSPSAAAVLEKLIQALSRYLGDNDVRLAEVISTSGTQDDPGNTVGESLNWQDVAERIRNTSLAITSGQYYRAVRLSELRQKLSDITRPVMDEILLQMDRSQQIELMCFEQEIEISDEDRNSALFIAGRPMHLLYLRR